jgi:hypothetical protein
MEEDRTMPEAGLTPFLKSLLWEKLGPFKELTISQPTQPFPQALNGDEASDHLGNYQSPK